MSEHSSGVVVDSEQLVRFVFLPMHHIDKKGNAKPNIFSHVHSRGCSIQRDFVASANELATFTRDFLGRENNRSWKGVLLANCNDVRKIKADETDHRAVCIYDTANPENPAHGELCQTQYVVEEADKIELRKNLFTAFGNGIFIQPLQYRDGAVWNNLPLHLQARK